MKLALFVLALVVIALAVRRVMQMRAPLQPALAPGTAEVAGPELIGALSEEALRREFGRIAFVPRTEPGQRDGAKSHFAGRPWLARGEAWPRCGECDSAMQLFLQLDLDALPDGGPPQRSGGLAQLFYCTNDQQDCEVDGQGWAAFSPISLARVVDPTANGAVAARDLAPGKPFAPRTILGWDQRPDLPNMDELEALGAVLNDEVEGLLENAELPLQQDKLGGWPAWVQSVEYPPCPECGAEMELLFQLESEEGLPYMFGDSGNGHLMRCKEHPRQLAFSWACM
jgi:hypothetical protein